MYRLIWQKPAHFLSAQMALVSTFFQRIIVLGMYNFEDACPFYVSKIKAQVSQQFWPNMAKVANQHIDWPWSQLDLDLLHRNCSLDGMISASRCALVLLTKLVGAGASQTFFRARLFTSQAFHEPEISCQISVLIKKKLRKITLKFGNCMYCIVANSRLGYY